MNELGFDIAFSFFSGYGSLKPEYGVLEVYHEKIVRTHDKDTNSSNLSYTRTLMDIVKCGFDNFNYSDTNEI